MKKQLFKLLVTIVDRAKGERIAAICREQGVLFQMVCLGHGTASSVRGVFFRESHVEAL